MKKLILFILFMTTAILGFCQSQRLVMFEEFTQASCGPCAQQNATFDPLLLNNLSKATSIRYHTSWPGVDPMNAQNPVDAGARVTYYGVNAVPFCFMDGAAVTGSNYTGAPANVTQTMIDNEYAVPSSFTISMYQQLSPANDTIYITMLGQCTQAVSGNFVAQIGVIEKHIHFTTPPGSNGETDFYNVMKKMLPTASGFVIPNSYQPGDYFIIQSSWKLAHVYSLAQLSAVGFIQNNTNKNILQAGNSDTIPLTMPFNNDVQLMATSNYSPTNCSGTIAPMVTIRNNGNDPVTSMTIKYTVNNGTPVSYTWNGNLPTLYQTDVQLPTSNFTPEQSNTLQVYADQVNNVNDEYPKNDTNTITIVSPPVTTFWARLILHTDSMPQQTTWKVRNSSGAVVDSGGPYTLPGHTYVDTVHLPYLGCYTFTIYDSGGNGICCDNGTGVYYLYTSTGVEIRSGASFGASESTELKMDWPTAVEQFEKNGMKVYPNPFTEEAKVTFYLMKTEDVNLYLYNATGQIVKSFNKGTYPSGNQECTIDASSLPSGIYMLKMQAGEQVHICKVSIIR
ncbi:MAG: T9SS type A sorting domain-containing protein [Bacteroidales bacterium]|jgi:hypothetical protein